MSGPIHDKVARERAPAPAQHAIGPRVERSGRAVERATPPGAIATWRESDRRWGDHAYEFRIGHHVPVSLARAAKQLARSSESLSIAQLRTAAREHGHLDDTQRMFLAGLLDDENTRTLARTPVRAGARVSFSLASIRAGMPRVKAIGRPRPQRFAAPQPARAELRRRVAEVLAQRAYEQTALSPRTDPSLARAPLPTLARAPASASTTAPKCSRVVVTLPGTMTFHGNRKSVTAHVKFLQALAPGRYKISYDLERDRFLIVPGPDEVFVEVQFAAAGTQSEIDRQIALFKSYLASMRTPVPMVVQGDRSESADGDATGAHADAAVTGHDTEAERGEGSGAAPVPPSTSADKGPPTIEIADAAQIDELRKRGLIPADEADSIKSKLGTDTPLAFDEAIALLDAMNKLIAPQTGRGDGETSWLEWARFVQQYKDKLSGTAHSADSGKPGLSPEDVKAIIAKEKEFVGIKDPPMTTLEDKLAEASHDPVIRKSWNALEPWERDLWVEYQKKHGGSVQSDRKDLHITADDKFWMALRMSPDYMEEGSREAARALFEDPAFITGVMVGLSAYLALWVMPEPVFTKATAVMTTIALASLITFSLEELINLAKAWMDLSSETKGATSLGELEQAAKKFGKRIGATGLRILVTLTMVLLGKALPSPKALPAGGPPMTPAPAIGPGAGGTAVAVSTVKVVNGAIVLVGPTGVGLTLAAAMQGHEGGGGGDKTSPPAPADEQGPYKDIKDKTEIRPGRDFTASQKDKIRAANRARNGGKLKSDDPNDPYQDLSEPVKSVSLGMGGKLQGGRLQDPAMAAVDHIKSAKAGGTNSYGNARVISTFLNNLLRAKGAK